ncbi:MAG: hypothetical protein NW223_15720 [Hyphomicrobiaceae bacterium]|nr:hypothetical protein [Hyphomicrobiaceae bacterium]
MRKGTITMLSALAVASVMAMTTGAEAACVKKAGQGTGGSVDSAKFQAWEAVLQATDWGSWAGFMAGGMKIGTAPGYKVSAVKSSCKAGGLGQECVMSATLCK